MTELEAKMLINDAARTCIKAVTLSLCAIFLIASIGIVIKVMF